MAVTIQIRRDQAADWVTANPVLAEGEMGLELDTGLRKVGDGVTIWTALPYFDAQQAGAADGQVLRWEDATGVWEASSDLVITDAGDVGIGTTTPANALHVVRLGGGSAGADRAQAAMRIDSDTGIAELYITTTDTGIGQLRFGNVSSTYRGALTYDYTADSMISVTAGTERMRIDGAGNVLVGGTTPATSYFAVNVSTGLTYTGTDAFSPVNRGTATSARIVRVEADGTLSSTAGAALAAQIDLDAANVTIADLLARIVALEAFH